MPIVTGIAGVFYILILIPLLVYKLLVRLLPEEVAVVRRLLRGKFAKTHRAISVGMQTFSRSEPIPFIAIDVFPRTPPEFQPIEMEPFRNFRVKTSAGKDPEQPAFVDVSTYASDQENREQDPFWEKI